MSRLKVLFVCHNHPSLHPGGSEIFAHDLFREMKKTGEVDAMFLACTNRVHREQKPGTNFQTIGRSSDELVLWAGHFDHFSLSQVDLHGIVPDLSSFLQTFQPDVVHFHHALLIGVEMLFLVRRLLPNCRIVFTLHDYYPICANHGQMVKTGSHELCHAASPDACGKCFPEITADKFVLREKHLKNLFTLVDRFIAPSEFLRRRFIEWGLDGDRIEVIRNGRPQTAARARRSVTNGKRNVFGYFGNLSPFKGVTVALDAARLLRQEYHDGFSLVLHGGTPFQTDEFKSDLAARIEDAQPSVSHRGPYGAQEMPDLLATVDWVIVPSIWWENAPLVIQEAFQQKRPVICSGIGGMAEAVQDGINGLHFRPNDPRSLMDAMLRAMETPTLWHKLVGGIPDIPTMTTSAAEHLALFADLLSTRHRARA